MNSSPKCGENNVAGDVCYMLTATDPEGSKVSCSLTTITGDPTAANGDEVKYDQDTITGCKAYSRTQTAHNIGPPSAQQRKEIQYKTYGLLMGCDSS